MLSATRNRKLCRSMLGYVLNWYSAQKCEVNQIESTGNWPDSVTLTSDAKNSTVQYAVIFYLFFLRKKNVTLYQLQNVKVSNINCRGIGYNLNVIGWNVQPTELTKLAINKRKRTGHKLY